MAPNFPPIEEALPLHHDLFYDGKWQTPITDSRRETLNPSTGQVIGKIADASTTDVDKAVEAAHKAFLSWKKTTMAERQGYMRRAAAILREHAAELALVESYNTGNPVAAMVIDAERAANALDYFAGLIPMLRGEVLPGPFPTEDYLHYTVREPMGVVARFVASNHPFMFAGARMASVIAGGNTVIIKPPEQAPLSCLRLAELLENVFPPGVVNILPGGAECGQALTCHPLVRKVSLIGSVATGKIIMRNAGSLMKQTSMELGGKNALIAFPDADIDHLVRSVAAGMNFTWAGQSCGSTSRVFLHDSIHDEVLARVVEVVRKGFRPGLATDPTTTMGSLISKAAQDRVLNYIASAREEGARLVTGGGMFDDLAGTPVEGGFFVQPTIFADVTPDMKIAREEIFGPVMSVLRWSDESELIRIVNSTNYGLTGSIFTKDLATAQRMIRQVEAGFVWVNDVCKHFLNVPYGGIKDSGIGRDECIDELFAYTNIKSVNINLGGATHLGSRLSQAGQISNT
ncbi:aldehdye dehydrogenase, putative [Talaromyces stipitatus ATCC 10500]|uniref:Aldehyde dehydrogenase tropH n=1 Tax=Talaromyces stipitatus (strain ATCC 10500 / CBS 375.48 / QM 6759 / NRRL 1006) TaxID=441959 RepID=TROPH_TALSN|nr:aldehdye dehydrogenase, putative [Talaromyces stipitatus ATCC 10500]B8M9K4.1 RecName: Full=Aldehyde dehydrogenase tropH; AltName: Full=Tropolone synthesis protein H [Talaromyces stipitatus ATCC 10500]EED18006.1 aldehdye dehydrogenase, putative [Talaromyces stipitatus ATCC 10500]DAA64705.1 TPA_exp: TropH [Talaromyces stipitatus ATCC 10500]